MNYMLIKDESIEEPQVKNKLCIKVKRDKKSDEMNRLKTHGKRIVCIRIT